MLFLNLYGSWPNHYLIIYGRPMSQDIPMLHTVEVYIVIEHSKYNEIVITMIDTCPTCGDSIDCCYCYLSAFTCSDQWPHKFVSSPHCFHKYMATIHVIVCTH